ncbi:MAG: hypothetical protein Kow0010_04550 [Dehalococcoidia bacterium]
MQRCPLCDDCARWIVRAAQLARLGRPELASILGAPVPAADRMARAGECSFCRSRLHRPGAIVEFLTQAESGDEPHLQLVLCDACEIWLASLVLDNRSARRVAYRDLDGEYGAFLHPNLRGLEVVVEVEDASTEDAILRACAEMGIRAGEEGYGAPILIVEAGADGRAMRRLTRSRTRWRGVVVVAPASAHHDLAAALALGASDWVTAPLTPQQLAAALARAVRIWPAPREWDSETCLPVARIAPQGRPGLVAVPGDGVAPFDLAWLLRRFARGYDDLLVYEGAIVLLPRATQARLPSIAERLERVLLGRCRFEPFAAPEREPFEATA